MLGRRHTHPKAGRKELHLRGIKMKRLRLEHMFIQTLLKMSTTHLHRLSLAILHRWSKKHNVELHNKSAKNLISALLEKQWKLTKERKNQLYPQWNFGYSFVGDSFCIFKFYFVVWSASHSCVVFFTLFYWEYPRPALNMWFSSIISECGDHRHVPACKLYAVLGINPGLCALEETLFRLSDFHSLTHFLHEFLSSIHVLSYSP